MKSRELNLRYKELYRRAYGSLAAAASLHESAPRPFGEEELRSVQRRISSILERELGHPLPGGGHVTKRFFSANSCLGRLMLDESISALCTLIYQIDDNYLGAAAALDYACRRAVALGAEVVACPSPLCPDELEAVLIPECSLAFVGGEWEFEKPRHMRIDALLPAERQRAYRAELRELKSLRLRCLSLAYARLGEAKSLHDELEAVYKPYMDFSALDDYTASVINALFS